MSHTQSVFEFVFEEAKQMISAMKTIGHSGDQDSYRYELKTRWKHANAMLNMAQRLAAAVDCEEEYETDEDYDDDDDYEEDEEMEDDEPQDAEMEDENGDTEDTASSNTSTTHIGEGNGC